VIQAMLENYEAAKEDRRAMCGDTGVPRWYVKIGNEARNEGGPIALEAALRRATANATHDVPLRPNRVHPLWRTDHNNNCGIGAPFWVIRGGSPSARLVSGLMHNDIWPVRHWSQWPLCSPCPASPSTCSGALPP